MAYGSEVSGKSVRARLVRQLAAQVLTHIHLASKMQQLYTSENENIRQAFESLGARLDDFFGAERAFRLHLEDGYLFVNETRLRLERATADAHYWILERLASSGLASLTLAPGTNVVELKRLVPILTHAVWPESGPRPAIEAELQAAFITNARVTMRRARDIEAEEAERVEVSSARLAAQLWLRLRRAALEACEAARGGGQISLRKPRALLQLVIDTYLEDEPPLLATTRVKLFAPADSTLVSRWEAYLATHMANTAILAIGLGHRVGVERRRLLDIGTAALFADVALARLPRPVVEAPGPLSAEARAEIDAHPVRAAAMILAADGGTPANYIPAAAAAGHHGARPGRAGAGRRSLQAAVIGTADAYDAMTTDRPWRTALPHDQALRELLGGAEGVETGLARVFGNLIGLYPVGAAVELAGGEVAVVVKQNENPRLAARPAVKVLIEPNGAPGDGRRLDLALLDRPAPIVRLLDLGLGSGGPADFVASF